MENEFKSQIHDTKHHKLLINNNKISNKENKLELEENNININSRNVLLKNVDLQNKYNNLLLRTKRNGKLRTIIKNDSKNNDTNSVINRTAFQTRQKSLNEITKDISDDRMKNINLLSRNSRILKKLKNKDKNSNLNRYLIKNKSSSCFINKSNQILPLLKPRGILINICSGPYEFKIYDINKKYFSFKQFGKNSFFMGDKYNPYNYGIPEKSRNGRNYYGAIYSN